MLKENNFKVQAKSFMLVLKKDYENILIDVSFLSLYDKIIEIVEFGYILLETQEYIDEMEEYLANYVF